MKQKEPKKCYCGGYWMPKWMQKILSIPFNPSCRLHDMHYGKQIGRKKADKIFLRNMIILANRAKTMPKRVRLRIMARMYYVAVRLGGWISYKKK